MTQKYAFCVDSDGCAMDTMTYKHQLFFGPLAADVFEIRDRSTFLLEWDRINLFSRTRGVNRFVGLVMALDFAGITGIENLRGWANTTTSLSNDSLEAEIRRNESPDLVKALDWSLRVNQGIKNYPGPALAFKGARESLHALKKLGHIYVVSSANKEAVENEWFEQGLMDAVEDLYCQDRGKKEDAIADLLSKGYSADHILMVGDSPGDLSAAKLNSVVFYPILVGHEIESWERLRQEVGPQFVAGQLTETKQVEYQDDFWNNLKE